MKKSFDVFTNILIMEESLSHRGGLEFNIAGQGQGKTSGPGVPRREELPGLRKLKRRSAALRGAALLHHSVSCGQLFTMRSS